MEHSQLQNSTQGFYIFADDSLALGTGKTGLTITATLSKSGGAANAIAPTYTEIGLGVYWVAPLAAHRDTLGRQAFLFAATGAVIAPRFEKVVAVNDQVASFGANTVAPDNAGIAANGVAIAALSNTIFDSYNVVHRQVGNETPVIFDWNSDDATITATRSINGGSFGNISGSITFLYTKNGQHFYQLSYHVSDRPNGTGNVLYQLDDGLNTRLLPVYIESSSVSAGEIGDYIIAATVTNSANSQTLNNVRIYIVGTSVSKLTNTLGVANLHVSSNTTYTLRVFVPTGFEQIDDIEVEVEEDNIALPIELTPISVTPSLDINLSNVLVRVVDQYGAELDNALVWADIVNNIETVGDSLILDVSTRFPTVDGEVTLELIRLKKYRINVGYENIVKTFLYTVPNNGSAIATLTV
jgi:hypothetical protein